MPTDYACQAAVELATAALDPLRAFLSNSRAYGYGYGPPREESGEHANGTTAGAAALMVFLDGLHADLTGEMAEWHAEAGPRIREALGAPVAGAERVPPERLPRGWQALALVQNSSQGVLTALAHRFQRGPVHQNELVRRLELVEDALVGSLRRTAVPERPAAQCAADLAAAAGSLFGLRPPAPPRAPRPPAAPPPEPPPAPEPARRPRTTAPSMGSISAWTTGLP